MWGYEAVVLPLSDEFEVACAPEDREQEERRAASSEWFWAYLLWKN